MNEKIKSILFMVHPVLNVITPAMQKRHAGLDPASSEICSGLAE